MECASDIPSCSGIDECEDMCMSASETLTVVMVGKVALLCSGLGKVISERKQRKKLYPMDLDCETDVLVEFLSWVQLQQ